MAVDATIMTRVEPCAAARRRNQSLLSESVSDF